MSPGYATTPHERLVAHLARNLPRHCPHVEFDAWRVATPLADQLTMMVGAVELEGYPGTA